QEIPLKIRVCREDIESYGISLIRWIEKHHILDSLRGNAGDHLIHEIPMRIKNGNPVPLLNVLRNHVQKERRFATTRDTDEMRVANTLLGCHRNPNRLARVMILPEDHRVPEGEGRCRFR